MRIRTLLVLLFSLFPIIASAQLGELVSPGELSKAHQKLSGLKNCNVCHGQDKEVIESKCLECHKDLAARISAKQGFHADKATNCTSCHTEHNGKDFDIRRLNLKTFHHSETGWNLEGLHEKVQCAACHKTRSFIGLSTKCESCHKDPHRGNLPNCESCHSVKILFKQVTFDHSATKFPLIGAHAKVECMTCHKNQVFKGLPFANCTSCHQDPHKGSLGLNCTQCHTQDAWKPAKVKHEQFPLLGKHADVPCAKCHPSGQWKLTAFARCIDCHKDPHLGQFADRTCETCHNVNGWKPAKYTHDKLKLELGHAIPCANCHKLEKGTFPAGRGEAVRFKPLKTDCVACHKDIHNGQLGIQCEKCHTTVSFKLTGFDHSKTRYPLDKVHENVPCGKCHTKDVKTGLVRYKPINTTCQTCHTDPHLGQLGNECAKCHTPDGVKFDHATSRFPLTGKHAGVQCEKCHHKEQGKFPAGSGMAIRYKPIATACATCHQDYHKGQFKQDCGACHNAQSFKPSTFEHANSSYPLQGAHAKLLCGQCHKVEHFETPPPPADVVRYHPISHSCSACHKDPHGGSLGKDCAKCHTELQWKTVSVAFHKVGRFPLTGRHLSVACADCHQKGVIEGTPTRCYDCHWIRRQDDRYRTRLGTACENCHVTSSWTSVNWNHETNAHVPLNAQHQTLNCDGCHVKQTFTTGEVNCYSCHQENYQNAKAPDHVAAGYPTTCQNCHSPGDRTWQSIPVNHNQFFPLVGVHATTACNACHKNGQFQGTPRTCYGCHKTNYDQTTNPNHASAGFPTNCDSCHKAADPDWLQAKFDHSKFYPLVGVHASQSCAACHKNGQYQGTPKNCYGCHKANYDATTNPDHKKAGFSTNCEQCHKPSDPSWFGSKFNHNDVFPLVGMHAKQDCSACHKNGQFTGTPRDCVGCHRQQYDQTTNPNHKTAGFPTNCDACHKASDLSWNQGKLNHNQFFPLVGVHASQPCEACHKNNNFKNTPNQCYGCHKQDYDQTNDPNHRTAGFPTNCDACHKASDSNWHQAKFNHDMFFRLVGVHAAQPCAACHKNGQYKGTPTDCYGCHRADYDATNDPNHRSAGFPTQCDACHKASDANWHQAKFNHDQFYKLLGVHATQPCAACHKNGVYKGTPTTCYGCHAAQYNATTNPNHKAAGFPTSCENCHRASDSSWNQGVFNHDWFPIKSGNHAGIQCNECHTTANNFSAFQCLSCHPRSQVDPHHTDVAGYSYDSVKCYHCHPNGRADD